MTKQTKFHDMISNVTAIIEDSNTCMPFINYKILGTNFYPPHPLKAQANTHNHQFIKDFTPSSKSFCIFYHQNLP